MRPTRIITCPKCGQQILLPLSFGPCFGGDPTASADTADLWAHAWTHDPTLTDPEENHE